MLCLGIYWCCMLMYTVKLVLVWQCVSSYSGLEGYCVGKNVVINKQGQERKLYLLGMISADPIGRVVQRVGPRPPDSLNFGFDSLRGHGCLSLDSVVCCQVQVSATVRSFVQRSLTERLCVLDHAITLYTYNDYVREVTLRKKNTIS